MKEAKEKEAKEIQTAKDLRSDINSLKAKLSDLSDFGIEINAQDTNTMKVLVSDVAKLSALIRTIDLPKEVKLTKETKVSFSDKTRVLLIGFFLFGLIFCGGSIWFSNWRIEQIKNEPQEVIYLNDNSEGYKWLQDFFFAFDKKHPNDTKNYIRKNPIPE